MMDSGLADRCRALGLNVIEVDGWKTRGRSYGTFAPKGSVNHHTAGATGHNAPSLGIVINGRSDLPGPLANCYMDRALAVYVIAAGIANHAGRGGWNGLVGNASVHGLEIENNGVGEPFSEQGRDIASRVHAAFLAAPGSTRDAANSCEHFEWSVEGKIDFYHWPGDDLRARIRAHLADPNPPQKPPPAHINTITTEEDMFICKFLDDLTSVWLCERDNKAGPGLIGTRRKFPKPENVGWAAQTVPSYPQPVTGMGYYKEIPW